MAGMVKLKNVLHGTNVVELKPWKSIHDTIKAPMVTGLGPIDIPESALSMGFARITSGCTSSAIPPTLQSSMPMWSLHMGMKF